MGFISTERAMRRRREDEAELDKRKPYRHFESAKVVEMSKTSSGGTQKIILRKRRVQTIVADPNGHPGGIPVYLGGTRIDLCREGNDMVIYRFDSYNEAICALVAEGWEEPNVRIP